MWYWIKLTYATGRIRTDGGVIVEAPPIWEGWIGQNIGEFYNYYQDEKKLIEIKANEK